jgi:hypothetical protein
LQHLLLQLDNAFFSMLCSLSTILKRSKVSKHSKRLALKKTPHSWSLLLGINAGTQGTGMEQSTKVEWTKVPQQGPKVKAKHSKEVMGGLPHSIVNEWQPHNKYENKYNPIDV